MVTWPLSQTRLAPHFGDRILEGHGAVRRGGHWLLGMIGLDRGRLRVADDPLDRFDDPGVQCAFESCQLVRLGTLTGSARHIEQDTPRRVHVPGTEELERVVEKRRRARPDPGKPEPGGDHGLGAAVLDVEPQGALIAGDRRRLIPGPHFEISDPDEQRKLPQEVRSSLQAQHTFAKHQQGLGVLRLGLQGGSMVLQVANP